MEIKNIELIKKIINNISIPTEIGNNEDGSESYALIDLEEEIWDLTSREACLKYGVTKGVIITNSNVVIKFPFSGTFFINEDEDEEEYMSFEFFEGANDSQDDWEYDYYNDDYCINELYKYNKIAKDGFGEFIAELQEIKNDRGNIFYLQEKIITKREYDSNNGNNSIHSENSKQVYDSLDSNIKDIINSNWMQDVIDFYGERKAVEFFNYIHNNNFDEDLHYGNLGYRENGAPVLFDLAGYRD